MSLTSRSTSLAAAVSPGERRLLSGVVLVELLLVGIYFGLTSAQPTTVRYVVYPLVWINVGLWAVLRTKPTPSSARHRLVASIVAATYFVVVAWIAGLVGSATPTDPTAGFRVVMASPGWGPMAIYTGSAAYVAFVPYLVVGYLSLSYLVYATVLDASRGALSGLVGLFSCVGCAFPVVASLVAGVAGGSAAVTMAVYTLSMDLSTVVFIFAIALLYWRPGFGAFRFR